VIRKLRVFIGKETQAQELAKNLVGSIGENLAHFQLTKDALEAIRATETHPQTNHKLFETVSKCFIDPSTRVDKTKKTRLHQTQQDSLEKLSKTIDDGRIRPYSPILARFKEVVEIC
jgi:hypothetical protein